MRTMRTAHGAGGAGGGGAAVARRAADAQPRDAARRAGGAGGGRPAGLAQLGRAGRRSWGCDVKVVGRDGRGTTAIGTRWPLAGLSLAARWRGLRVRSGTLLDQEHC